MNDKATAASETSWNVPQGEHPQAPRGPCWTNPRADSATHSYVLQCAQDKDVATRVRTLRERTLSWWLHSRAPCAPTGAGPALAHPAQTEGHPRRPSPAFLLAKPEEARYPCRPCFSVMQDYTCSSSRSPFMRRARGCAKEGQGDGERARIHRPLRSVGSVSGPAAGSWARPGLPV